jgi:hypothetical protein
MQPLPVSQARRDAIHRDLIRNTEYLRVTWTQRKHDPEALAATNFDAFIDMIREPLGELRRTRLEPPATGNRPATPIQAGHPETKKQSLRPGEAIGKIGPAKGPVRSDAQPPTSNQLEEQQRQLEKTYNVPRPLKGRDVPRPSLDQVPDRVVHERCDRVEAHLGALHREFRALADALARHPGPDTLKSDPSAGRVGREIETIDRLVRSLGEPPTENAAACDPPRPSGSE